MDHKPLASFQLLFRQILCVTTLLCAILAWIGIQIAYKRPACPDPLSVCGILICFWSMGTRVNRQIVFGALSVGITLILSGSMCEIHVTVNSYETTEKQVAGLAWVLQDLYAVIRSSVGLPLMIAICLIPFVLLNATAVAPGVLCQLCSTFVFGMLGVAIYSWMVVLMLS